MAILRPVRISVIAQVFVFIRLPGRIKLARLGCPEKCAEILGSKIDVAWVASGGAPHKHHAVIRGDLHTLAVLAET